MRIRKNENIFIFLGALMIFALLCSISLIYFLGFEITNQSLIIYSITIACILGLGVIIYVIFIVFNKRYIIFGDTAIIEKSKNNQSILIKYSQILHSEYNNIMSILFGFSKGGRLLIYYLDNNKKKVISIGISKKNSRKIANKIRLL